MSIPTPPESDRPGGDLTEHGADPDERQDTGGAGDATTQDAATQDAATQGEVTPAGDLTDHGVDPASRD